MLARAALRPLSLARPFSRQAGQAKEEEGTRDSVRRVETSQAYIREQVKRNDHVTFLTSFFQPPAIRPDYLALYWFDMELSRLVFDTREKPLGLGKLDFWAEAIENIYLGVLNKEPISVALAEAVRRSRLPKSLLLRIIQTHRQEIDFPDFPDYVAMEERAEGRRSALILAHLRMLRMDFEAHPQLFTAAEYAGRCLGVVDYIRRVPYDLSKYRLKLPLDICQKHSIFLRNLWNRQYGTPKEELYDVLLTVASYARENLLRTLEVTPPLPPQAYRAFLPLLEAELYLEELEKANFEVFAPHLNQRSLLTLPLRLAKAARQGRFTHKSLEEYKQ